LVRASLSSRWHPGKMGAAAAGRQVRSTLNFGTVSAARMCDAVKMIGNSGMVVLPYAVSRGKFRSHITLNLLLSAWSCLAPSRWHRSRGHAARIKASAL
jgi:hypothetical protein